MDGQPLSPVAALFDAVAPVYETVGPPFFDHFGPLLVEHAGVRSGDRVLDLAAGSGAVAVPALAMAGPSGSLLAVDVAPGMVERLAARLSATGHPAACAELGDATGLEALRVVAAVGLLLGGGAEHPAEVVDRRGDVQVGIMGRRCR